MRALPTSQHTTLQKRSDAYGSGLLIIAFTTLAPTPSDPVRPSSRWVNFRLEFVECCFNDRSSIYRLMNILAIVPPEKYSPNPIVKLRFPQIACSKLTQITDLLL